MRYQQILLGCLLTLFAVCGFVTLSFYQKSLLTSTLQVEDAEQVLRSFQEAYRAVTEINLDSMYGTSGKLEVLNPLLELKNQFQENSPPSCWSHLENREDASEYREADPVNCRKPVVPFEKDTENILLGGAAVAARKKTRLLQEALVTGIEGLDSFLMSRPLVDEEGRSYALWLVNSGVKPYSEKKWIEEHLSYFTLSELKGIIETYNIRHPVHTILAQLTENEVRDLIKGAELVFTREYLFLRDHHRLGFSPLSFLVYRTSDFHDYLRALGGQFELVRESEDIICLLKVGNACWTYSANHFVSFLFRYSLLILFAVGLLCGFFLWSYIRRVRNQQQEQNKKRLALQVLSHEFRTPVASMLLKLERLNENSSRCQPEVQDLITLVSRDVYRLQRIIEVSKTYLQAEGNRIHFNFTEVLSANEWITDFVNDLETDIQNKIEVQLLSEDRSFKADLFWLKFVLNNLVQNAFFHGKAPIFIRLECVENKIKITVEDQGDCEFDSLEQMTEPFVKSGRSKGMGLGLNITKHIVDEWGSRISYSSKPTSFSLELRSAD
jgi:hypothetical protein